MIKLLIVEDEDNILEGLAELFRQNGFNVAGLAHDGQEGYKKILTGEYDLVVTDIKMPGMNGLELMKECLQLKDKCPKFVILTGNEKFEYAKEALNLGALAFISKLSLIDDLKETVKKINDFFKEKNNSLNYKKLESTNNIDINKLKSEILEFYIEQKQNIQSNNVYDDLYFISFGISNKENNHNILKLNRKYKNQMIFNLYKNLIMITFFSKENNLNADKIMNDLKNTYKINSAIFYSKILKGISGAAETLTELSCIYASLTTDDQNNLIFSNMPSSTNITDEKFAIQKELENNILKYAFQFQSNNFYSNIDKWLEFITINYSEFNDAKQQIIALSSILLWKLEEGYQDIDIASRVKYNISLIENESDFLRIKKLFIQQLHELENILHDYYQSKSTNFNILTKAKKYIRDNITDKITLNDIAQYCYMSPSYFSHLFSTEFGETFSTYVNRKKMEKATQLLQETKNVNKVAEILGYTEVKTFRRIFQKLYGVNPSSYCNTSNKK